MSDFIVRDTSRGTDRPCDTRAEAEETRDDMIALGADPGDIEIETADDMERANVTDDGDVVVQGGTSDDEVDADVVDMTDDDGDGYDLPDDPPVDTDPLVWMPDEFQDEIDGTIAINRKGFEVLAHHYDIQTQTDMVERTEEIVVHKATAETADGLVYTAYGEAHASEDTPTQLVRLSDTRAYKRAVSRATGVGLVAVAELQNEL